MTWRRTLLTVAVLLVLGAGGAYALAWRPAIAAVVPPGAAAFDPALVAQGARLAAVGDCAVCHTAPGGRPYAGGRALPTPFGTIFTSNLTPDADTGLGRWSEAAFRRAMHDGVDRAGRHLYPALPYDHYTNVSDDDLRALYAFLQTRMPVTAAKPANRLPFPLNVRATLEGWKLLFFRPGPFQPDPAHDARWNRGAYLVEGLAHCGACHTPRNALGAEQRNQAFSGGAAEGWYAPALDAHSPAPAPWTEAELYTYLRTGEVATHGAAAGPMAAVAHELRHVPDADVRAIAAYFAPFLPQGTAPATAPARAMQPAEAALFAGACAACHAADAPMVQGGGPVLARSTALNAPDARDALRIILQGVQPSPGQAGAYMPAYADVLTDAQVAALAAQLRARYTDKPAWPELEKQVRAIRQGDQS